MRGGHVKDGSPLVIFNSGIQQDGASHSARNRMSIPEEDARSEGEATCSTDKEEVQKKI